MVQNARLCRAHHEGLRPHPGSLPRTYPGRRASLAPSRRMKPPNSKMLQFASHTKPEPFDRTAVDPANRFAGERDVFRPEKTCLQDRYAVLRRDSRDGARHLRVFAGMGGELRPGTGAGHSAPAIHAGRGNQTVRATRPGNDGNRQQALQHSASIGPSGLQRAKARRRAGAAAGSSREDRAADQGAVVSRLSARHG